MSTAQMCMLKTSQETSFNNSTTSGISKTPKDRYIQGTWRKKFFLFREKHCISYIGRRKCCVQVLYLMLLYKWILNPSKYTQNTSPHKLQTAEVLTSPPKYVKVKYTLKLSDSDNTPTTNSTDSYTMETFNYWKWLQGDFLKYRK